MEKKLSLIFFCMMLFLIPFVISIPPITTIQQFPTGYILLESPQEYIELNQDYQYNFFVYNYSTGVLIDNTTLVCDFFLANSSGEVIFSSEVDYNSEGYWNIDILGGNFSKTEIYIYGISCQDVYGGALTGGWEVIKTDTGLFALNNANIIYLISIIFIFLIGIFIYFNLYSIASITTIIFGFVLLFNKTSLILSVILICVGLYLAFRGEH